MSRKESSTGQSTSGQSASGDDPKVTLRVPAALWKKVKLLAVNNGVTAASIVVDAIRKAVEK